MSGATAGLVTPAGALASTGGSRPRRAPLDLSKPNELFRHRQSLAILRWLNPLRLAVLSLTTWRYPLANLSVGGLRHTLEASRMRQASRCSAIPPANRAASLTETAQNAAAKSS